MWWGNYFLEHTKKNSCSSDFPDKNSEVVSEIFVFLFFMKMMKRNLFSLKKELVLIGCVQYMIS
jgi:hypothetical protein